MMMQIPKEGFINDDQASDSSIGSGSSDQGIEPGHEGDDEFTHDITGLGVGENEVGGEDSNPLSIDDSQAGGEHREPAHGLVEEGPGPDA